MTTCSTKEDLLQWPHDGLYDGQLTISMTTVAHMGRLLVPARETAIPA
jgi:hypothetical protein